MPLSKFIRTNGFDINHDVGEAYTVPIDRILSVKNARAWVSMDST